MNDRYLENKKKLLKPIQVDHIGRFTGNPKLNRIEKMNRHLRDVQNRIIVIIRVRIL